MSEPLPGYDDWKTRAPEDDEDDYDEDAWEAEQERRYDRHEEREYMPRDH